MSEWYVVQKSSGQIVNCIMTSNPKPDNVFGDDYYLTTQPTQAQLEGYRYYWERP